MKDYSDSLRGDGKDGVKSASVKKQVEVQIVHTFLYIRSGISRSQAAND